MDGLSPANTVLDELATVAGDLGPGSLRSILGGFMFSGDDVFKKAAVLSGGEKARLALAKIMLTAPNLLLLDEPTNHLDIPGRQMLEDALSDYGGTLVLISHDRHFINGLCTGMGVIENGRLEVYPGDYDDYQTLWQKNDGRPQAQKSPTPLVESEARTAAGARAEDSGAAEPGRKEARRREAEARKELAARRRPLIKKMEEAEARLEAISARKEELAAQLAAPATYQDAARAKALNIEFQQLTDEAAVLEAVWEEAATALDTP
jgi:ATP-binding cassette subfamily F protein 3